MLVQKNSGQNIFSLQCFWFKKIKGQRNFSSKQFSGSRNVGQKIFGFQFCLVQQKYGQNSWVQKNYDTQKLFGQNLASNS